MHRWAIAPALALAIGLALPAWAGDAEDCNHSAALLKSEQVRAVAACSHLAEQGDAAAQFKASAKKSRWMLTLRRSAEKRHGAKV